MFFRTNISVSTGGRGFTRKNTRIVLFYSTLICATAYQHSVTCLERTGFSKLKDIVVKFTFHEHCSVFVEWCRNVGRLFMRINLAAEWLDIHMP